MVKDHVNSFGQSARRSMGFPSTEPENVAATATLPVRAAPRAVSDAPRGRGGSRSRGKRSQHAPRVLSHEESLQRLFLEQHRLTKSVQRQARLLKVDKSEVKSIDSELLRRVTNDIIRVSADMAATIQPDQYNRSEIIREVTGPQEVLEDLLRRQGARLSGAVGNLEETFQRNSYSPRLYKSSESSKVWVSQHHQFCQLEGPALRLYLNAVRRGYLGGPAAWLRSRYSRQALPALARKGLIGPLEKRDFSVFSPKSPLRFVLGTNTYVKSGLSHGFRGEGLVQYGDYSTLVRQKKGPKCPLQEWPVDPRTNRRFWPSSPTINESWEMFWKGVIHPLQGIERSAFPECITLEQVRDNPELARNVVRENLVGFRAWVPIPEKFRWYFKYRWGCFIPRPRIRFPIGVVRFLLSLWLRCPNQCLLLVRSSLRCYLKYHIKPETISVSSWSDGRLRNFLSRAPVDPREEDQPESFRPTSPIRFMKSGRRLRTI